MISAVVVNYHTENLIEELLPLLEQEDSIKEIFVVDNSGTFPSTKDVCLLKPKKNLGFGPAVNLAAQKSRFPYLLVINPDVRPLPGSIEALLEAAQKLKAVLVGPRFFWDEEKIFRLPPAEGLTLFWVLARKLAALSSLDREVFSFYWRLRHEHFWQAKEPFWEPFLSGACLLIRKEDLPEPFDTRFFLYYEDTDLAVRTWGKGRIFCVPQAEMIHFWNQSPEPTEGKATLMRVSERLFLKKYYPEKWLSAEEIFEAASPKGPQETASFQGQRACLEGGGKKPPYIRWKGIHGFLELALNPWFIPFAQAKIENGSFSFPANVWERMPPGRYFVRIVGPYQDILWQGSFTKDVG